MEAQEVMAPTEVALEAVTADPAVPALSELSWLELALFPALAEEEEEVMAPAEVALEAAMADPAVPALSRHSWLVLAAFPQAGAAATVPMPFPPVVDTAVAVAGKTLFSQRSLLPKAVLNT